ncbi:MAG: hypothetical protein HY805_05635 [Nitrospirae bacterium]|nr:hypothetical protein [Nitrospirota bacterium]
MYNPLEEIETAEKALKEGEKKALPYYKPSWGKEIHERNVFSPKRSEVEPLSLVLTPKNANIVSLLPPAEKPLLNLKGIIRNEHGEYIALIEKGTEKAIPLRKGDRIGDVLVVEIRERTVDLMWNEEKIRLSMEKVKTIKR